MLPRRKIEQGVDAVDWPLNERKRRVRRDLDRMNVVRRPAQRLPAHEAERVLDIEQPLPRRLCRLQAKACRREFPIEGNGIWHRRSAWSQARSVPCPSITMFSTPTKVRTLDPSPFRTVVLEPD